MEKITQHKLLAYAENLGLKLHTEGNKEIFNSKIPDAWYIDEGQRLLLIFECKQQKSQWKTQAKAQLQEYCSIAKNYANSHNLDIIPVFVYGTETIELYSIFDFNSPFETEFKELYPTKLERKFNFDPHKFNQYIYENFPTISSDERLKIVISVLLTKSQNVNLTPPLFLRVLETESRYNMEEYFKFISEEPYKTCVDKMFEFLENVPNDKVLDVLYTSFVEISKWSFKGISGTTTRKNLTQTEGAVLTPPDIVSLMISSLNISSADIICDPCCGTGNFLLEALKYTQRIKGNELDLTRSIIAKHGLIISGITSPDVTNFDCKISTYSPDFDYLLLNPPYDHKKEQEICIKFMELSKKGGAIIIPSSNFRDDDFMSKIQTICHPLKLIQLNKKVFYPVASVVTSVLIYSKIERETLSPLQYYDFTDDGYVCDRIKGRTFKGHKEPKLIETNEISKVQYKNILFTQNKIIIDSIYNEMKNYISGCLKIEDAENKEILQLLSTKLPKEENDMESVKVGDLFEIVKKNKNYNYSSTNLPQVGSIPLFACRKLNNGVAGYVEKEEYETTSSGVIVCVKSREATCGYCFAYCGKLAWTNFCCVVEPKDKSLNFQNVKEIALKMTVQIAPNHRDSEKFTPEELLEKIIKISKVRYVRFGDYFEFVDFAKKSDNSAVVPVYGATQRNESTKTTNIGIIETNETLLSINTTGDGACGFCHIMKPGKFALSSRYLFKPKENIKINFEKTAVAMSSYVHYTLGYCRSKGVSKEKFINEIVPIYLN